MLETCNLATVSKKQSNDTETRFYRTRANQKSFLAKGFITYQFLLQTCCCDVITIEIWNCARSCCYPWCLLILYLSWQAHLSQWPLLSWFGWKKTPAPSAWLLRGEPTRDNLCLALSLSRLEDLFCVCVWPWSQICSFHIAPQFHVWLCWSSEETTFPWTAWACVASC